MTAPESQREVGGGLHVSVGEGEGAAKASAGQGSRLA